MSPSQPHPLPQWMSKHNSCLLPPLTIQVTETELQYDTALPVISKQEKENCLYWGLWRKKKPSFFQRHITAVLVWVKIILLTNLNKGHQGLFGDKIWISVGRIQCLAFKNLSCRHYDRVTSLKGSNRQADSCGFETCISSVERKNIKSFATTLSHESHVSLILT